MPQLLRLIPELLVVRLAVTTTVARGEPQVALETVVEMIDALAHEESVAVQVDPRIGHRVLEEQDLDQARVVTRRLVPTDTKEPREPAAIHLIAGVEAVEMMMRTNSSQADPNGR